MPGPRRHTAREAALSGPMSARKHRERYGTAASAADLSLATTPPAFLDAAGKKGVAQSHCRAAPPGLLHKIDVDILAALAATIAVHKKSVRLSQEA